MNRTILYINIALCATTLILAGCATIGRRTGKVITATPSPCILTPDSASMVRMDLIFHVPERYLSSRSRLVITPILVENGKAIADYAPLVLDAPVYGKKLRRKEVLGNFIDPYGEKAMKADKVSRSFELPYSETLRLPEGSGEGRVVAVVSEDGCGECAGIDTIDLAEIRRPAPVEEPAIELAWMEPGFVIRPKVVDGKGVAHLQFTINKSDIDLSLGNNREELEGMTAALSPIIGDTLATMTALTITGMASADGSLAFNTTLARNRATAAKEWLVERLRIGDSLRRLIQIDSRPEGWEPVLAAMTAAGNPDSAAVKRILETYADGGDDVQERYIRRLPCWNEIRRNYLQKNRKVEYTYSYTLRSFATDAELLDMYGKRPDAFNEEELLRVATLAGSRGERIRVYQTILRYFPQSAVAKNNLAVLYVLEGRETEARELQGVSDRLIIKEGK